MTKIHCESAARSRAFIHLLICNQNSSERFRHVKLEPGQYLLIVDLLVKQFQIVLPPSLLSRSTYGSTNKGEVI